MPPASPCWLRSTGERLIPTTFMRIRGPSGVGNRRADLADQRLDLLRGEGHEHERVADLDPALLGQRLADDDLLRRPGIRITSGHDPGARDVAEHHIVGGRARRDEGPVGELDRERLDQRGRLRRPGASGRRRPPTVPAGGRRRARRRRGSTSQTGRRSSRCGERRRSPPSTTAPATPTTSARTDDLSPATRQPERAHIQVPAISSIQPYGRASEPGSRHPCAR